jgi:hypothetical protein
LENLILRYTYLVNKQVIISETKTEFIVKLPVVEYKEA